MGDIYCISYVRIICVRSDIFLEKDVLLSKTSQEITYSSRRRKFWSIDCPIDEIFARLLCVSLLNKIYTSDYLMMDLAL